MSTAAKTKKKSKTMEALEAALDADPKDVKVHLSMRLDLDIYRELKRRAQEGEAEGKYQSLMNNLLREALFAEKSTATNRSMLIENKKLWDALYKLQEKVDRHTKKSNLEMPAAFISSRTTQKRAAK